MKPNKITVHCSASLWGDAGEIRKWHTDPPPRGNGWRDIGYHKVILNGRPRYGMGYDEDYDGLVQDGRPEDQMGAHVLGHNQDNLGVCLIGITEFTPRQMGALKRVLMNWMDDYKLKISDIYGHNEFSGHESRICPGFNMTIFRNKFRMERFFI